MSAPNITSVLKALSGQISDEIYSRSLHTSPWLDLPKQENWPEGQGYSINVLTLGRSLPRETVRWTTVEASANTGGGACIPAKQRLEITNAVKTYNLQQTALESPDLCMLDLMNSFKAEQQLSHMMEVLTENTRQVWIDRNRSQYVSLATNKLIATKTGFVEPVNGDFATSFTADDVTQLTGNHLKNAYARMVRLGAGKNSYGNADGRPSFLAVVGMETNELLNLEVRYRQDIRESSRVPELLAPLGIERMFKGFYLADEVNPPRFNLETTTTTGANPVTTKRWVEVKPYVWSGTGATAELIENPDYASATYEDTIIYHPDVFRSVIMPPARSYGQAKFNPQTFRGDWNFLNIANRDDNPDQNYGFFRGVFANGSKPVFPQYGFVIRHKRPDLIAMEPLNGVIPTV
jgi:hypothetical protein